MPTDRTTQSTAGHLPLRDKAGMLWLVVVVCILATTALLTTQWERAKALDQAEYLTELAGSNAGRTAEVRRALQAMALLTVVLEVPVTVASGDESWRGDVRASVSADAKLFYGIDLSKASVTRTDLGALAERYTITVAPPQRLASEITRIDAESPVELGWLRFRRLSGEYHIAEARRKLPDAIAALRLSEQDAAMVRQETLVRLETLVKLITGVNTLVEVRFSDEPQPPSAMDPSGIAQPEALR